MRKGSKFQILNAMLKVSGIDKKMVADPYILIRISHFDNKSL